jgi:hypothetical protein
MPPIFDKKKKRKPFFSENSRQRSAIGVFNQQLKNLTFKMPFYCGFLSRGFLIAYEGRL